MKNIVVVAVAAAAAVVCSKGVSVMGTFYFT